MSLSDLLVLAQLPADQVMRLFDHVPNLFFFVKDREGRFLAANQPLLQRMGLKTEADILGTRDRDRYPPHLADRVEQTDQQVLLSGEALLGHLDILFDEGGALAWFKTTKLPLRDQHGRVVGVMGFTYKFNSSETIPGESHRIGKALEMVRRNPRQTPSVPELATKAGLSQRQLNRHFQQTLGISPQEFLLRCRIHAAAAELRNTRSELAEIASEFGFCDQSAFTRQFRQQFGTTPAEYRKRYGA